MVRDLIVETLTADDGIIHISDHMLEALNDLRGFLFDRVYTYYEVHNAFIKAQRIIRDLYSYFLENGLVRFTAQGLEMMESSELWQSEKEAHRKVCDYIAGMTDRYALSIYKHIFIPEPWSAR
ncbi:MAG: hypothetical protein CSB28_02045 [Desulfobacterales bacterium]|nr:MAG: hypothetical protein CSB28_02045 [Desulfobacterales bacterium]